MKSYQYLDHISSPEDLKKLDKTCLSALADEIRDFLVEAVTKNGGHLASNLGVVELTLAMHRVFDSPKDHFIFDVGHQAYVHKIITGRKDALSESLRQNGGLSGFTKRSESPHDPFGAGHASTSISAAIGIAAAEKKKGSDAYTVCVVGDGAFTGGMIHEALNNVKEDLRLIIILNENEMSISPNTGRFAQHLMKIRFSAGYHDIKSSTRNFLQKIPLIGHPLFKLLRSFKKSVKDLLYHSNYFEDLGLYYLGPADGNNYQTVETLLNIAKSVPQSVILHLKTKKGSGWAPAERYPDIFHAVPKMKYYQNAEPIPSPASTFSEKFGETMLEILKENKDVQVITAAMAAGTGLRIVSEEMPDRITDVGIAEEHAITYAAGLSAGGIHPVAAIYSSFLQRSYDNLIHDAALQNLPMTVCIDRAGYNEGDGVTHHGIFDVAMLSPLPNATIFSPVSFASLDRAIRYSVEAPSLTAIRYPKGEEDPDLIRRLLPVSEGDFPLLTEAVPFSTVWIIAYGRIAKEALLAKDLLLQDGISVSVAVPERLTPFDVRADEIASLFGAETKCVLFLEEGVYSGGASVLYREHMGDLFAERGICSRILAIRDPFLPSEKGKRMIETAGLDAKSVRDTILKMITCF